MANNRIPWEAASLSDWWSNGLLGKLISSITGKYLGTNLTPAEQQANEFSREMAREANQFTHQENQLAMQFSGEQASQQMAFQERMANTSYQRAVSDMQAAGINPAIAYSQGGAVAPSGAAAVGSSGSGAAVSSVVPHAGSLSDLMRLFTLKKEMKLLDAQAEQARASAAEHSANAENVAKKTSWIDRLSAADLGLTEETARKTGAEVESILASSEGQRLWNEWNPKLWEQLYRQGEVDIEATVVGIAKTMEEIEKLKSSQALDWSDVQYNKVMKGLATAQTSLTKQQEKESFARTGEHTQQAKKLSAEAFQEQWRADFIKEHGVEPGAGTWQSMVQAIAGVNHLSRHQPAPKRAAGR